MPIRCRCHAAVEAGVTCLLPPRETDAAREMCGCLYAPLRQGKELMAVPTDQRPADAVAPRTPAQPAPAGRL
jgi:hypothetical protein